MLNIITLASVWVMVLMHDGSSLRNLVNVFKTEQLCKDYRDEGAKMSPPLSKGARVECVEEKIYEREIK